LSAHFQKPTILGPRSSGAQEHYVPPAPLSFQMPGGAAETEAAAAKRKNLPDWLRAEIEKRQLKAAGEAMIRKSSSLVSIPCITYVLAAAA